MALNDLYNVIKADRYTADGCEKINEALAKETEDRVYQNGEISQKTGLMKTPKGWVEPPKGKAPKAKAKAESKPAEKSLAGTPMKKADLKSKDPYEITHSMKPDTASEAKEMDKITAFMEEETGANLGMAIQARESFYKNTKNPTPEQQEGLAALMKIQQKLGYGKPAEGPALNGQKKTVSHQEYQEGPLYGPAENKPAAESKPAAPKPSVQEYMKAQDTVKKLEEIYKKKKEDYDYTQRVKANGADISLMFPYNVKPQELSENEDYVKAKDIIQRMEAEDSAPRQLTGDCKIRIRKA